MADEKKIIASVYGFGTQTIHGITYQRCFGSHGFEVSFNPAIPIEQYKALFEKEARDNLLAPVVILYTLKTTVHNEDGTFKRDKKGNRLDETIYKNNDITW